MAQDPPAGGSHVSNPINRIRWATQRASGASGQRKRHSIMERFQHRRSGSAEKKRDTSNSPPLEGIQEESESVDEAAEAKETSRRRIFFNIPLPDDAKDEDGHPLTDFGRNKVRTAKYTPLSFVPKNLYFQFHQIANVYFFIIIILDV